MHCETELERLRKTLECREERLRSYADRLGLAAGAAGFGTWEWDVKKGRFSWDENMYELYEVLPEEFDNLYDAWLARVHPEDVGHAEGVLEETLNATQPSEWEFRILLPGGKLAYILSHALCRVDQAGQPDKLIGINVDVTERTLALRELRIMATTDALTGVLNRRHFMDSARRELERCQRYPKPFSIAMFDVDMFRTINDSHGIEAGDSVLMQLARVASEQLREVDILGRVDGGEFCVAMPETEEKDAELAAERLLAAIRETDIYLPSGEHIRITASMGVSSCLDAVEHIDSLLSWADMALHKAKSQGRDRVVVYQHIESYSD